MRVVTLGGLGAVAPYVQAPGPMLSGLGNTGANTPYGTNPIVVAQADEAAGNTPTVQTMLPIAAMQTVEARGHSKGFWIGLGVGVITTSVAAYFMGRRRR